MRKIDKTKLLKNFSKFLNYPLVRTLIAQGIITTAKECLLELFKNSGS